MVKTENYIVDPKTGNGTLKEVKVAKGNPRSKHDNDYRFGPKGPGGAPNDHSGQNLPTSKIKV